MATWAAGAVIIPNFDFVVNKYSTKMIWTSNGTKLTGNIDSTIFYYYGKVGQTFITKLPTLIKDPTSASITGLPTGLSFDPILRNINGQPTTAGTFLSIYKTSNANGEFNTIKLTLIIAPRLNNDYVISEDWF